MSEALGPARFVRFGCDVPPYGRALASSPTTSIVAHPWGVIVTSSGRRRAVYESNIEFIELEPEWPEVTPPSPTSEPAKAKRRRAEAV